MDLKRILFALPLAAVAMNAATPDWSRFRGPNGSGVADGTFPTEFGPDKNLIWKTPLPPGHSSPILYGDHIILTAFEGADLLTICVNRTTGRVEWRRPAPRPRTEKVDPRNSPASPSAAVEDNAIYVFFGDYGLVSY